MNYSQLKAVFEQFRLGRTSRAELVGAIALWQRPVDCARSFGPCWVQEAVEAVIR
jgi:hypothetical protein